MKIMQAIRRQKLPPNNMRNMQKNIQNKKYAEFMQKN